MTSEATTKVADLRLLICLLFTADLICLLIARFFQPSYTFVIEWCRSFSPGLSRHFFQFFLRSFRIYYDFRTLYVFILL